MPKPDFEIVSASWCDYCKRAKEKLNELGLEYTEQTLDTAEKIAAFKAQGFKTIPQIFHKGELIGGYMELLAWLEKNSASLS